MQFLKIAPLALSSLGLALLFSGCSQKEPMEEQLHATLSTNHGDIVVKLFEKETPKTVANFVGLADGTRLLGEGEDPALAKPFYDGLTFHRVIDDFMIQGGCPKGNGTGGPGYSFEDECYASGEPITGKIETQDRAIAVIDQVIRPYFMTLRGAQPSAEMLALNGKVQDAQSFDPLNELTVEDIKSWTQFEGEVAEQKLIHEVSYGTLCMANSGPNTNGSQFFIVTKKDGCPWLNGKHTVFGAVIAGMEVADAIQKVEKGPQDNPKEPVVIQSIRVQRVMVPVASSKDS